MNPEKHITPYVIKKTDKIKNIAKKLPFNIWFDDNFLKKPSKQSMALPIKTIG
jgi:hypothetical protein